MVEKTESKPRRDTVGILREAGIEVKKTTGLLLWPEDAILPERGHHLWSPRCEDEFDPLDEEFVVELAISGVQVPIEVQKDGEDPKKGPRLLVVKGRRRTRHLREVNARCSPKHPKHDPSIYKVRQQLRAVYAVGDDKDMTLRVLSENGWRKDDSIFSKAIAVKNALTVGNTEADVAREGHIALAQVKVLVEYLNFSEPVRKAFEARALPVGAIKEIAKLPGSDRLEAIKKMEEVGAKKIHQVKQVVRAKQNGEDPGEIAPPKMMSRTKIEEWAKELDGEHRAILRRVLGFERALDKHTNFKPSFDRKN